jgi:hypothetical protein
MTTAGNKRCEAGDRAPPEVTLKFCLAFLNEGGADVGERFVKLVLKLFPVDQFAGHLAAMGCLPAWDRKQLHGKCIEQEMGLDVRKLGLICRGSR